ncbi:MAG: hypothetical protein ACO3LH_05600 [Steroidobacteraceae bacterium]
MLSLKFAESAALRMVDHCDDLEELKTLSRSLIRGHFEARQLIGHLMLESLEQMSRQRCSTCPTAPSTNSVT